MDYVFFFYKQVLNEKHQTTYDTRDLLTSFIDYINEVSMFVI
jgi:hypothetical protein